MATFTHWAMFTCGMELHCLMREPNNFRGLLLDFSSETSASTCGSSGGCEVVGMFSSDSLTGFRLTNRPNNMWDRLLILSSDTANSALDRVDESALTEVLFS